MMLQRRRNRVIASPRARRAMRERGIDPNALRGSGPGGRIVEADVLAAAKTFGRTAAGSGDPRRAPCSTLWLQATADVTGLMEIRRQMTAEVERSCGTPLRLADFLLRAMGLALADCPRANCVWQGDRCVEWKTADVGFEIDTAEGRLVLVIAQADRLRLVELVAERKRRQEPFSPLDPSIRENSPAKKVPGTFSATSLCDLTDYLIDHAAAVLLPPRTSVLAAGRPKAHGMVVGGQSSLKHLLGLTLTADQRAISPETAAALLGRIVELLEHPFLLLCERLPR